MVRVSGPAGSSVTLLQMEAGLYTAGLPGGGFDIDPFEANSIVAILERTAILGGSGSVDFPVTLLRSSPASGLNYFVAVMRDASGRTGTVSANLILVPEDCNAPPIRSVSISIAGDVIEWTPLPGATTYDLVRGGQQALHPQGDFGVATLVCLVDQAAATLFVDPAIPAPGDGFFYLARGNSCGGRGTFDSGGAGQVQSRDAGIAASAGWCP
jgi:hypothetical protein